MASGWEPPEERKLLTRLLRKNERPERLGVDDLEHKLQQSLPALATIFSRPPSIEDRWAWATLDAGATALAHLRRLALLRSRRDPEREGLLGAAEWETLLTARAPWWQDAAGAALSRLVPGPITEAALGEVFGAALRYLDELLLASAGSPFDSFRASVGRSAASAWATWAPDRRIDALSCLRPWHWGSGEDLSRLLDRILEEETNPRILAYAVHAYLGSRRRVAAQLDRLLARVQSLPEMAEIGREIGQVLGDASVHVPGASTTEIQAVSEVCRHVLSDPPAEAEFRHALINGIAWGAHDALGRLPALNREHAERWLPLAHATLHVRLYAREARVAGKLPLQPIMSVLEKRWPVELRAKLYDGLADLLEMVLRSGSLDDFKWLHHWLRNELNGKITGNTPLGEGEPVQPPLPLALSDELLLRLCRASAGRLDAWRSQSGESDEDASRVGLSSYDTFQFLRAAYDNCQDRDYLRRGIAPLLEILARVGRTEWANELRLHLRQG